MDPCLDQVTSRYARSLQRLVPLATYILHRQNGSRRPGFGSELGRANLAGRSWFVGTAATRHPRWPGPSSTAGEGCCDLFFLLQNSPMFVPLVVGDFWKIRICGVSFRKLVADRKRRNFWGEWRGHGQRKGFVSKLKMQATTWCRPFGFPQK